VGRIISSSNTLPILSNLLIKTENGLLKISSTNLEIAITTQVRCKIEEEGQITVVSKTFSELINSLPNSNVTLLAEGGNLKIESENYHTSIKTLPAEEFPLIPQIEGGNVQSIDAQELKNSLDQVAFAASTNQTQPEISGVLLAYEDNILKIVATDRYRLAEKKITLGQKNLGISELIIPQKTILELTRIIGNQKGNVEISNTETQIALSFNDTQIVSRLIDGSYPDYKQIIPASFSTMVTVQKQPLANALKAAAVFSQSSNSVKFEFFQDKQQIVLTSESSELGNSQVEVSAKIEGGSKTVILNYHYILDCLSSLESDTLVIKLIDDSSPSIIVPEKDGGYTYLVMPIKT
jgi:DNA polymerase-3 subunit beta